MQGGCAVSTVIPHPKARRGVKLAEQVAQEIVADITRSHMAPGDRFPSEVMMAQERGISRGSLREALRILELHGLINIRTGPGGGPELAEVTAQDFARMATLHYHLAGVTFRQLLEARIIFEPRMAQLAAARRTPDQMLELRAIVREHGQATDVEGLVYYAHAFHTLVSTMAGNDNNKVLSLITSSLHGIFDVYSRRQQSVDVMTKTVEVHRGIAEAIEIRDTQLAGELMEQHMEASAETFATEHPTLIDSTVSWMSD